MLRRTPLALAAAAVAVALFPGPASAAPEQAREGYTYEGFSAHVQLTVPGVGQPGGASISRYGYPSGGEWNGSLFVSLPPEPCAQFFCFQTPRTGSVQLTDEQITFGRDLKAASVTAVPITLSSYRVSWDTGYAEVVEELTVSLTITGTGRLSHDVMHGDYCGEGWPCQSLRVEASRTGTGVLTATGGLTATGVGGLSHGHSVEAAVAESTEQQPSNGSGNGSGDAPSNGSGDAPTDGSGDVPSGGSGDAPTDGSGDVPSDGSAAEPSVAPEPSPTTEPSAVPEPAGATEG